MLKNKKVIIFDLDGTLLNSYGEISEENKIAIKKAIEKTKNNTGIVFNIAFNYGGRDEIVCAVKNIANEVKKGKLELDDIDEEIVSNHMYTKNIPDPDLIIRTSGEIRLSGFLIWQSVYSEILFVEKLWPDFLPEDLDAAIEEYKKRNYSNRKSNLNIPTSCCFNLFRTRHWSNFSIFYYLYIYTICISHQKKMVYN